MIPIILFASLLPDVDHTRSLIGKLFYPIAREINRRFGHRTITHSLIALIGFTTIVALLQRAYFPSLKIAQVFGLAYASHILLDMITVAGVPLFYPFKKNACVLPGRADLRFRSGNIRHETMCLCIFTVSAVFLQPLFANGFWTSYNRLFGTLAHVESEFNKSDDLMKVHFTVQHGSETFKKEGYCINATSSDLLILNDNHAFEHFPKDGQIIADVYPIHTDVSYTFSDGTFVDISLDSLVMLFNKCKYAKFNLQANKSFVYHTKELRNNKRALKLKYPNNLHIEEIIKENKVSYITNPRIATKLEEIRILEETQELKYQEYHKLLKVYDDLRQSMEREKDHIKKELLMIKLSASSPPKMYQSIEPKLSALRAEIKQMQTEDNLKHQKALEGAALDPLRFSGTYQELQITGLLF